MVLLYVNYCRINNIKGSVPKPSATMGGEISDIIDDRVLHILMKVENKSMSDVVEELAEDSEIEELLEMRENLFKLSKDRLEYGLRKEGKLGEWRILM